MLIVSGHLIVDADHRAEYLEGGTEVVALARAAAGCLDFALSPDLVDPARINVYERWTDDAALHAFRGSGPTSEQRTAIRSASVRKYRISAEEAP